MKGGGACRPVHLHPRSIFAMDIAQLLSANPEGLLISKIVPAYKEKFGRELVVANFGYPKLIRALEAIPDVLEVSVRCVSEHSPCMGEKPYILYTMIHVYVYMYA